MGNWRRVHIIGTCAPEHVHALHKALDPGDNYERFHCLSCGGIAGLQNWAAESINAVGNLGERDYSVQAVADTLLRLLQVAPSLKVKVHCGDEYEADNCIKTITAQYSPIVVVGDPEVSTIPEKSADDLRSGMLAELKRAQSRFR